MSDLGEKSIHNYFEQVDNLRKEQREAFLAEIMLPPRTPEEIEQLVREYNPGRKASPPTFNTVRSLVQSLLKVISLDAQVVVMDRRTEEAVEILEIRDTPESFGIPQVQLLITAPLQRLGELQTGMLIHKAIEKIANKPLLTKEQLKAISDAVAITYDGIFDEPEMRRAQENGFNGLRILASVSGEFTPKSSQPIPGYVWLLREPCDSGPADYMHGVYSSLEAAVDHAKPYCEETVTNFELRDDPTHHNVCHIFDADSESEAAPLFYVERVELDR